MKIPAEVKAALMALRKCGYEAYPVGGCVRDSLMGRTPGDWDLCTSARPEEMKKVFACCRLIETGIRHGTVTVLMDGRALEITTFRTDGAYSDVRHPDGVHFTASLTEDLRRRDFTCNAMAWSAERGLIDPFGGEEDLRRGILRCVGDPAERFREDALRLLRALRFAARFGFTVETETARAIHEQRLLLRHISPERIFSELCGILVGDAVGAILREFDDVFYVFLPELEALRESAQPISGGRHGVWEHTIRTVEETAPETVMRLAALFSQCGGTADGVLRRLRCDNARRVAVGTLAARVNTAPPRTVVDVRRELAAWGAERSRQLHMLRRAAALAQDTPQGRESAQAAERAMALCERELAAGGCLSVKELAVKGGDLLAAGIPAGPELRQTLEMLLDAVIDGRVPNEREALLAQLRRWAPKHDGRQEKE